MILKNMRREYELGSCVLLIHTINVSVHGKLKL
jgi:hypothetical protein